MFSFLSMTVQILTVSQYEHCKTSNTRTRTISSTHLLLLQVTVSDKYQVVYNFTLYSEQSRWNETEHYVFEPPQTPESPALEIPVSWEIVVEIQGLLSPVRFYVVLLIWINFYLLYVEQRTLSCKAVLLRMNGP